MTHPVAGQIESLLQETGVWYERFDHEPVRTSEEAARVRPEYSLAQGAKALIVRVRRGGMRSFCMLVLPGAHKFDSQKVRAALQATDIRFATEDYVRLVHPTVTDISAL